MKSVYIHPTALVDTKNIGAGTRIWAYTHILRGATIGKQCVIGDHCYIESGVVVGDRVTIKNGNMLWEGVTVESGAFVGPHVFFTNDLYPRSPRLPEARFRYAARSWLVPTRVRHGASLGAGAVVLAGVSIGRYATVGAGAVVTKDVAPHALVVGNPARRAGWVCLCGNRVVFTRSTAVCRQCGRRLEKARAEVRPIGRATAVNSGRAKR